MADNSKKPRTPVGRLSRADLMALGKVLDHGPLVSEPIPERFQELLRKLDEREDEPPA